MDDGKSRADGDATPAAGTALTVEKPGAGLA
jgi:hypothetical protein